MNTFILFAFVGVVVASTVSVTDAVECYVCSTSLDGDSCGDPFKSAAKASDCAQCIKGKASADEVSVITRSCSPIKVGENGCHSGSTAGASGDICYCDGNLCNTSSRVSISLATSLGVGLLVCVVKML